MLNSLIGAAPRGVKWASPAAGAAKRRARHFGVVIALALAACGITTPALAQVANTGGNSVVGKMVDAVCSLVGPLAGSHSQVLSLIFLLSLGVIVVMWLLNENKEGLIIWMLRTGFCLAVLINLFTLPQLLGLPPVCGGA